MWTTDATVAMLRRPELIHIVAGEFCWAGFCHLTHNLPSDQLHHWCTYTPPKTHTHTLLVETVEHGCIISSCECWWFCTFDSFGYQRTYVHCISKPPDTLIKIPEIPQRTWIGLIWHNPMEIIVKNIILYAKAYHYNIHFYNVSLYRCATWTPSGGYGYYSKTVCAENVE